MENSNCRKIYVASAKNGPTKIGISYNPEKRAKELQGNGPVALTLVHFDDLPEGLEGAIERCAHRLVGAHRLRGEWFDITPEDAVKLAIELAIETLGALPEEEEKGPRNPDAVATPKEMTPIEMRMSLRKAGLGQTEFARLIGREASSIRNQLAGIRPISGELALALRLLVAYAEHGSKERALQLSDMAQDDLTPPRRRRVLEGVAK